MSLFLLQIQPRKCLMSTFLLSYYLHASVCIMNGSLPIRAVFTLRKRRFRLLKAPSSDNQNGVYGRLIRRFHRDKDCGH